MTTRRHISLALALLFTAGCAVAQSGAGEWVSYRDAYRAMVVFEKYGKPKNFVQNHFQVAPRERGDSPEGLHLTLDGTTTQLNLALDATGRTVFPLLKAAYDENAALLLNRKPGQYAWRARVSIVVRPDGVYEVADLRAACEQALGYERHVDASLRAKKCVGVRFAYARKGAEPGVRLRKGEGEAQALPAADGAAFAGDSYEGFKVVNVRFGALADKAQVVTQNAPLAIAALYE